MKRPPELLRDAVTATRERRKAVTSQSERNIMLSTVLIASAVSAVTAYFLTQCYSVDVLASLLYTGDDCWMDWGVNIGRHCFSDYAMVAAAGIQSNPWEYSIVLPPNYQPITIGYPAAGWIPQLLFAAPAHFLGIPRAGLICYLIALTMAVLSPAIWASRAESGLNRAVIFITLGVAAIPLWAVVDRGNSAGFIVPIALTYFVALRRQKWLLVTAMVILASMVKPQFVVLAFVFFAAREWRRGSLTLLGIAASNTAAFLIWPRDFPRTITQSLHTMAKFNNSFGGLQDARNVSFGRALLLVPDALASDPSGKIPEGFLSGPRSMLGYLALALVVVSVLTLGKRIPTVMAGIVLLATSALFPSYASFYYLVFTLPIAAIIVRDPNGSQRTGIFDPTAMPGGQRRAVGICVSLATAFSIAQIAIPKPPVPVQIFGQFGARGSVGSILTVPTTVTYVGLCWLIACVVIVVSYARRSGTTIEVLPDLPQSAARSTATAAGLPAPDQEPTPARDRHAHD